MAHAPTIRWFSPCGKLPEGILTLCTRVPLLLYAILCMSFGLGCYLLGVAMVVPRYLFGLGNAFLHVNELIVWYSGLPIVVGFGFALIDLFVFFPIKRRGAAGVRFDPVSHPRLTVALTAYNDEESISAAVKDFVGHPFVEHVIVVSNNSTDHTLERALAAGAIAFNEPIQGYGRCVYRCLTEAAKLQESDFIVLCEGDRTFRAYDLGKLLAYAPHADIVNGTRIVEKLRQYSTQLSTFMYYGNLFVGKLLEAKHLGRCTITDVGSTFKLCRRVALQRLLPALDPEINLEFNAHFLDTALGNNCLLVECPVTFHTRVGLSKAGNADNLRALKVGCRMMIGIILGWRYVRG